MYVAFVLEAGFLACTYTHVQNTACNRSCMRALIMLRASGARQKARYRSWSTRYCICQPARRGQLCHQLLMMECSLLQPYHSKGWVARVWEIHVDLVGSKCIHSCQISTCSICCCREHIAKQIAAVVACVGSEPEADGEVACVSCWQENAVVSPLMARPLGNTLPVRGLIKHSNAACIAPQGEILPVHTLL